MSLVTPPAMRIKSHWFKPGGQHGPEEQAAAMAFITFRVANQAVKRMRAAQFDVDAGAPYLLFLQEMLVFLVAVVDRIAHARLDAEARQRFTTALVNNVSRHLAENQRDLSGPEPADSAPYEHRFIDFFNELSGHYAEFGADPQTTPAEAFRPDFAFVRYLGSRLEAAVPLKDRRWVMEQMMAVEAPDALAIVQRSMRDLHDPAPRAARATRRASLSGE